MGMSSAKVLYNLEYDNQQEMTLRALLDLIHYFRSTKGIKCFMLVLNLIFLPNVRHSLTS